MSSREFSANVGPLVFSLEWRLTLFTLILLPLLVSLGFWQLDRADEKRVLAARHSERMAMSPMRLDELRTAIATDRGSVADRQVTLAVTFAPDRYLLLDNRLRDGRFGYEVIALARTANVLVPINLGWVEGDPARRVLPSVTLPSGERTIAARVYVPGSEAYVLTEQQAPTALPAVIQSFPAADFAPALSQSLHNEVLPVEVRISARDPIAYRADWSIVNQSPEKHTGYAVQWFTMSAVLLIAFLLRSCNVLDLVRGRERRTHS